jgi:hypothetical protein
MKCAGRQQLNRRHPGRGRVQVNHETVGWWLSKLRCGHCSRKTRNMMTVSSQTLNNTIDTHPRGILTRTCRRVRDDGKELRSTKIDAVRRTSAHPDQKADCLHGGGIYGERAVPPVDGRREQTRTAVCGIPCATWTTCRTPITQKVCLFGRSYLEVRSILSKKTLSVVRLVLETGIRMHCYNLIN